MMNGFRILRINHNLQKIGKDVYVFEDSKELCDAMEKYSIYKNSKEEDYGFNNTTKN